MGRRERRRWAAECEKQHVDHMYIDTVAALRFPRARKRQTRGVKRWTIGD